MNKQILPLLQGFFCLLVALTVVLWNEYRKNSHRPIPQECDHDWYKYCEVPYQRLARWIRHHKNGPRDFKELEERQHLMLLFWGSYILYCEKKHKSAIDDPFVNWIHFETENQSL